MVYVMPTHSDVDKCQPFPIKFTALPPFYRRPSSFSRWVYLIFIDSDLFYFIQLIYYFICICICLCVMYFRSVIWTYQSRQSLLRCIYLDCIWSFHYCIGIFYTLFWFLWFICSIDQIKSNIITTIVC